MTWLSEFLHIDIKKSANPITEGQNKTKMMNLGWTKKQLKAQLERKNNKIIPSMRCYGCSVWEQNATKKNTKVKWHIIIIITNQLWLIVFINRYRMGTLCLCWEAHHWIEWNRLFDIMIIMNIDI